LDLLTHTPTPIPVFSLYLRVSTCPGFRNDGQVSHYLLCQDETTYLGQQKTLRTSTWRETILSSPRAIEGKNRFRQTGSRNPLDSKRWPLLQSVRGNYTNVHTTVPRHQLLIDSLTLFFFLTGYLTAVLSETPENSKKRAVFSSPS